MNTAIRAALAFACVMAIGVGILDGYGTRRTPPAQPTRQGEPFLPVYLRVLGGEYIPDTSCTPPTWQQLVLPCDQP